MTNYLFSGADVTGRDELLATRVAAQLDTTPTKPSPNAIVRSSTVFAIAMVAYLSAGGLPLDLRSADTADLPIDMAVLDAIAARIANVTSEVPPNRIARAHAFAVLEALRALGLEPTHVVADHDGGVSVYVFADGWEAPRFVRVLATNEHEVVALCEDRSTNKRSLWAVDPSRLEKDLQRVRAFIGTA